MSRVIQVENLSKLYRLGTVNSGVLKDDIYALYRRLIGKSAFDFEKIETNDRTTIGNSDYVWSLKDISFDVSEGDVLGIIGKNGAGKSTLLKILSKVTAPTKGSIRMRGTVSSLLEVGTGFHPELSGRENIYLNGAILGMRKHEIKVKFDEIVAFAGVERYIDTPVKRYSSGMYVRLAFAVAAHLESDILIVDEVLAVGDAEFQKKCMSKMKSISGETGKTILFVSHNIDAIERLCNKGVFLENGEMHSSGEITTIVKNYLSGNLNLNADYIFGDYDETELPIKLKRFYSHTGALDASYNLNITQKIFLTIELEVFKPCKFIHGINITNEKDVEVFHSHDVVSEFYNIDWAPGIYNLTITIPENLMAEGIYSIGLGILNHLPYTVYYHGKDLLRIKIIDPLLGDSARGLYNGEFPGIMRPKLSWQTKLISDAI